MCPYSQCKKKYTIVFSFTGHMSKMYTNCGYNTDNVQESHDNDEVMESTSELFELLNEANGSVILPNNCELELEVNDQLSVNLIELKDVGNDISYDNQLLNQICLLKMLQSFI